MRETQPKTTDKIEIVKQAKKQIQKVLIGKKNPQKNHTLFEINLVEKTILKATFDKNITITFSDAQTQKRENKSVTTKKDCIYRSALNKKNVVKILKRENIEL